MRNPTENQHDISHKKLAFREHQYWGSSMMTLNSFVTKVRPCRGKLIKMKQSEKHFVKILVKGLKMTLACSIWPLWLFWGICYIFCLPKIDHQMLNCPSMRCIVPAKISRALTLCQKSWFCGKICFDDFYRLLRSKSFSWIHIGVKRISQACCLNHLKIWEKYCKTRLWNEKQNRALFWTTL